MNSKTLQQADLELRHRLEENRKKSGTLFRLDGDVGVKTDKIIQNPIPSKKTVEIPPSKSKKTTEEILNELLELGKEIDTLTKMPINLAEKHGVTQEVASQVADMMNDLKDDEFEKKEFLNFLDGGKCVNLSLKGFKSFKILKLFSTDAGNDIFIVSFTTKDGKKSLPQRFVIKFEFPIKKGSYLQLYKAENQDTLGRFQIEALDVHKKSLSDKVSTVYGRFN